MNKKYKKILFATCFVVTSVLILAFSACTMPTGSSHTASGAVSDGNGIDAATRGINAGAFSSFYPINMTEAWTDISEVQNNQNRIVIADMQTFNGKDACAVRFDNDNDNGQILNYLSCHIEEEQTYDTETAHTYAETVEGLFVNAEYTVDTVLGKGELFDVQGNWIGNAVYTNVSQDWQNQIHTLMLQWMPDHDFLLPRETNPFVVFSNVRTFSDHDPVHVRILNQEYKTGSGHGWYEISYKLEEWVHNNDDNRRHFPERVEFLILKPGVHEVGSTGSGSGWNVPVVLEVGTKEMPNNDIDWDNDWMNVNLITLFRYDPLIITQSQTFRGNQPCITRNKDITLDSFKVLLQEEEYRYRSQGDRLHNAEKIGYIAYGPVWHDASHSNIVTNNGLLDVDDYWNLVNENGQRVQLKGVSAFWTNWEPGKKYVNDAAIKWLVSDWKIRVYRAAIGVNPMDPRGTGERLKDEFGNPDTTGYVWDPAGNLETAEKAIRYCIRNGIYVIVDWHVHNALDPANKEKAIEFFDYISKKYGMYDNVMYELWNEPGWHDHVRFEQGIIDIPHESSVIPWNEIKDYCSDIIDVIRANDSDNIIICPSPCWDQYIEEVSKSPITSDEHIMYSFHFYAGSHLFNKNGHDGNPPTPAWLIYWSGDDSWNWTNAQNYAYSNNMTDAAKSDNIPLPTEMGKYGDDDDCPPGWDDIYKMTWSMHFEPWMKLDRTISDDNGSAKHHIPIFVTEWGTTLYDGGQPDTSDKCFINAAQEWVSYMDGHFLSWCNWSVSDKNEGASLLKPGASPNGGWSESALTTSGKYIRNKLRESY